MPEAGFRCWKCQEFVRADFRQDSNPGAPSGGYLGNCPKCGSENLLLTPSLSPQALNKGYPGYISEPGPEAPHDGRASLLEHLIGILEPAKRDVRAFLSDEDLPEELFVISQNVWNYLDRALKKAKELA